MKGTAQSAAIAVCDSYFDEGRAAAGRARRNLRGCANRRASLVALAAAAFSNLDGEH